MLDMFRTARAKQDRKREATRSQLREQTLKYEMAIRRAEVTGHPCSQQQRDILSELNALEGRISTASREELDDLTTRSEWLARHRAYLCPPIELQAQGRSSLDLMEEWGVPKSVMINLRALVGKKLDDPNPAVATGAYMAILEEYDSWSDYVDDYEGAMNRASYLLVTMSILFALVGLALLHYPKMIVFGLFAAGAIGGCISVLAKLPPLSPTATFAIHRRKIRSRVVTVEWRV